MADLIALCFDANDPSRLARFWGEALLWESDHETRDVICLVPTDGTKFQVAFRPLLPPGPKVGKNSIHLDLTTSSIDDQNETVARLLGLGARHIDIGQGRRAHHVVLADPEGNEFCVIEPENSFLAGCADSDRSPATVRRLRGISGARHWDGRWSGTRTNRLRSAISTARIRSSRGVRRFLPRPRRTGSIWTSLLPTSVISNRRSTISCPLGRPESTSAARMGAGRSWPIPTAISSASRPLRDGPATQTWRCAGR
jgi:hypothetical protein